MLSGPSFGGWCSHPDENASAFWVCDFVNMAIGPLVDKSTLIFPFFAILADTWGPPFSATSCSRCGVDPHFVAPFSRPVSAVITDGIGLHASFCHILSRTLVMKLSIDGTPSRCLMSSFDSCVMWLWLLPILRSILV